jgi:SAM-dependent methyltransferase
MDIDNIYDQIAEQYAEYAKVKPYNVYLERPAIRALVPDIQGAHVLDAGCGPGTNISWLIEQGAQKVLGIDASAQMISIAGRDTLPNVSLSIADLSQPLDFLAGDSFDLIFSSLVVHYIEDIDRLFADFARLLRPGGSFVFSTHHPQGDFQRHPGNYFATKFVSDRWRGFGEERITMSFYRRPLSAITEALANAYFIIERMTEAQPTADFRRVDPERYEKASKRPTFLCVRARRP